MPSVNPSEPPLRLEEGNVSKIALGTCAWSSEDWRGSFYPEALPQAQWLNWYSQYFNSVEVDSTFYHPPGVRASAHWLAATPEHFTFTVKLSRVITHDLRLRDGEPLLREFLEGLEPLRPKLGCVLVQLPPGFKPKHDEAALRQFVSCLPRDWRFAIEFRDPAWHVPRVVHWLNEHGVCWVWPDTEPLLHEAEGAFEWLPQTADFIYIRLLGDQKTKYSEDGSRVHRYGSLKWARDRSIENWAVKVRHHLSESRRVYVYVNNHFEGSAPLTCQRLAASLGMPMELPHFPAHAPVVPERQLDLL